MCECVFVCCNYFYVNRAYMGDLLFSLGWGGGGKGMFLGGGGALDSVKNYTYIYYSWQANRKKIIIVSIVIIAK